ncbi:ATP-binding protein [Paenibacillus senegalensis]|uniref:ATP-binding protein n=1 Tax=Paenibacillus senegalensis TaxID=1465766 RepID=UPI000287DABA|nr:ATP-binding protein [Paenibacillus senegalensis]
MIPKSGTPVSVENWEYHWGQFPMDEEGNFQWERGGNYEGIHNDIWISSIITLNPPHRGARNVIWYRVQLPPTQWSDPSLNIQVHGKFRIYSEKKLIYQFGDFSKEGTPYQGNAPRIVPLPTDSMGKMLYVEIHSDSKNIGFNPYPTLASHSEIILDLLKKQSDRLIIGCFYILTGMISLSSYFRLRIKPFFTFGLFGIFFGIYTICRTTIINFFYDSPLLWADVELAALVGGMASVIAFLVQMFGEDRPQDRALNVLWKLHLIFAVVTIPFIRVHTLQLDEVMFVYHIFMLASLLVLNVYVAVMAYQKNRDAQIVLLGTLFFSLMGVIDFFNHLFPQNMVIFSISYLGMVVFLFSLIGVLIRRTVDMIARLRNSEKLSLVGQLAAGIAHEVRNPLTIISGNLQLMQQKGYSEETSQLMLSEIKRINSILNEFLYLAKPNSPKLEVNNLMEVLNDVVYLFQSQVMNPPIQIIVTATDKVLLVKCDPNQLKKVFVNLLRNAVEAMPDGGKIRIVVRKLKVNVIMEFIDEGTGIAASNLKRLNEPFYTTKEGGTGLGLSISRKIIEEHQGKLQLESELNHGTIVKIVLPLARKIMIS